MASLTLNFGMERFAVTSAVDRLLLFCCEDVEPPQCLDGFRHDQLNLAVVGGAGNGKSELVNTMRCVAGSEPDAARTGVDETTMEPTPYPFHGLPFKVTLWDIPGTGTEKFPTSEYVHKLGLRCFDVVIIVCGQRFTEMERKILDALKLTNMQHFLVRSKVDIDDLNGHRKGVNTSETLRAIRSSFTQVGMPKPYLISSLLEHRPHYDFHELMDDLINAIFKARSLSQAELFAGIRRQHLPCFADKESVAEESRM